MSFAQKVESEEPLILAPPSLFVLTTDTFYQFDARFDLWQFDERFECQGFSMDSDQAMFDQSNSQPELNVPQNCLSSSSSSSWLNQPFSSVAQHKVASFQGIHFTAGEDSILIIESGGQEVPMRFFDDRTRYH